MSSNAQAGVASDAPTKIAKLRHVVPPPKIRRTQELRRGRFSYAGTRYFVTFVTEDRRKCLLKHAREIISVFQKGHDTGDWNVSILTVMPDHIHVLFTLGTRLSLGQCVGRWKSQIGRLALSKCEWQRDFWEHRLRAEERSENFGIYVFLNPYRAHLISKDKTWPWTWMPAPAKFYFSQFLTETGTPNPEWFSSTPLATPEGAREFRESWDAGNAEKVWASLAKPATTFEPLSASPQNTAGERNIL